MQGNLLRARAHIQGHAWGQAAVAQIYISAICPQGNMFLVTGRHAYALSTIRFLAPRRLRTKEQFVPGLSSQIILLMCMGKDNQTKELCPPGRK